jgi:myo-inositol 2-dehydrogenase / D-chiro-inositol 1-dehydrogenase
MSGATIEQKLYSIGLLALGVGVGAIYSTLIADRDIDIDIDIESRETLSESDAHSDAHTQSDTDTDIDTDTDTDTDSYVRNLSEDDLLSDSISDFPSSGRPSFTLLRARTTPGPGPAAAAAAAPGQGLGLGHSHRAYHSSVAQTMAADAELTTTSPLYHYSNAQNVTPGPGPGPGPGLGPGPAVTPELGEQLAQLDLSAEQLKQLDGTPFHIVVVGAGRMGTMWGKNILETHGKLLHVCAVVDPNQNAATRFSAMMGQQGSIPQIFASLDECFDAAAAAVESDDSSDGEKKQRNTLRIDGVLVACPTKQHRSVILLACRHRVPVFCEKPVALTYSDVRECYLAAHNANIPLICGWNRRYDPKYRRLHAQVADDVYRMHIVSRDHPLLPSNVLVNIGSIFDDLMVHEIDIALWFMKSQPISVFASAASTFNTGVIDNATAVLEFPGNRTVVIETSRFSPDGYDQRIEVLGHRNYVAANDSRRPAPYSFPERYRVSYLQEVHHFVRVIARTRQAMQSDNVQRLRDDNRADPYYRAWRDDLWVSRVAHALDESHRTGCRVYFHNNSTENVTQKDSEPDIMLPDALVLPTRSSSTSSVTVTVTAADHDDDDGGGGAVATATGAATATATAIADKSTLVQNASGMFVYHYTSRHAPMERVLPGTSSFDRVEMDYTIVNSDSDCTFDDSGTVPITDRRVSYLVPAIESWRSFQQALGVAFIGCGQFGTFMLDVVERKLVDESLFDVRAVHRQTTPINLPAKVWHSDRIHLVYICAPSNTHMEYAKQAMLSGKHVLCELPLTLTSRAFHDLANHAHTSTRVLRVNFHRRFSSLYLHVKYALYHANEHIDPKIGMPPMHQHDGNDELPVDLPSFAPPSSIKIETHSPRLPDAHIAPMIAQDVLHDLDTVCFLLWPFTSTCVTSVQVSSNATIDIDIMVSKPVFTSTEAAAAADSKVPVDTHTGNQDTTQVQIPVRIEYRRDAAMILDRVSIERTDTKQQSRTLKIERKQVPSSNARADFAIYANEYEQSWRDMALRLQDPVNWAAVQTQQSMHLNPVYGFRSVSTKDWDEQIHSQYAATYKLLDQVLDKL